MNTTSLYNHLMRTMSSERFLKMQGLNQDIPFFICPFKLAFKQEIEAMIPLLISGLEKKNIQILEINLYDLCIEYLKQEELFNPLLQIEAENDKNYFMESLQSILDVERTIIPCIEQKLRRTGIPQILFLTGIGEVFPYLRTHNLLNNLQRIAKEFPTVLFFPGEYEQSLEKGATLKLFNSLPDDKYYRAYNITQWDYMEEH